MARPTPSIGRPPSSYGEDAAIGEVTILVYEMKGGQSEVRVRYPREALPGSSGASAKRQAFHSLVVRELQASLKTFDDHS